MTNALQMAVLASDRAQNRKWRYRTTTPDGVSRYFTSRYAAIKDRQARGEGCEFVDRFPSVHVRRYGAWVLRSAANS